MRLVALLCIQLLSSVFSSSPMSFLIYGLHACIGPLQYSKLTIASYRGTIKLLPLYDIFIRIIPITWLLDDVILHCKVGHVAKSVSEDRFRVHGSPLLFSEIQIEVTLSHIHQNRANLAGSNVVTSLMCHLKRPLRYGG